MQHLINGKDSQDKAFNLILWYLDDNPQLSSCNQFISHKNLELQETFIDIYVKVDNNENTQMTTDVRF